MKTDMRFFKGLAQKKLYPWIYQGKKCILSRPTRARGLKHRDDHEGRIVGPTGTPFGFSHSQRQSDRQSPSHFDIPGIRYLLRFTLLRGGRDRWAFARESDHPANVHGTAPGLSGNSSEIPNSSLTTYKKSPRGRQGSTHSCLSVTGKARDPPADIRVHLIMVDCTCWTSLLTLVQPRVCFSRLRQTWVLRFPWFLGFA